MVVVVVMVMVATPGFGRISVVSVVVRSLAFFFGSLTWGPVQVSGNR